MKRRPLNADPEKVREFQQRAKANSKRARKPISPASHAQRVKVKGETCVVCEQWPVDPAHLIDRSLCPIGQDDERAVIGLCRKHHSEYDEGKLSLLEHLEPWARQELAYAVERFGLIATLERVTNTRYVPAGEVYEAWMP